jgi:hypothetical protein
VTVGTHSTRRAPRLAPRPLGLICLGLVLLGVAWAMSSQPFQAPDEASHYLRGLEIANGKLLGPRAKYPAVGIPAAEYAFASHDTRAVEVPAAMSPGNESCADAKPDLHGCIEVTPTGDYYPVAYVLPSIGLVLASNANEALWLARILSLLPCLALIIAGLLALWDTDGWSIAGALAALTPMVLFVCAIFNPSGLEIAANFAFVAAAFRIARGETRAPRFVWIVLALAGVLTIDSFQSGPVSAVADLAIVAGLIGATAGRELLAANRRPLTLVGGLLLAALVAWAVYSKASGVAHSQFDVNPFWTSLQQGLTALRFALQDAVGTFGSLTVPLPMTARWLWWSGIASLVLGALVLGGRRQRIVVAATVVLVLLYPVLFYAWVYRLSGYALQGRQVLPLLMLIPLLSGEVVHRQLRSGAVRSIPRAAVPVGLVGIAVFQAYAWWYNARDSAGAPGTDRFYAYAHWSPPLGWLLWIAVAGLGTVALIAAAAVAYRIDGASAHRLSSEALP